MSRGNGGRFGPFNTVTPFSASGIWTLSNQQQQKNINAWPGIPVPVDYLVVGGGSGGSYNNTFGVAGSGGGVQIGTALITPGASYIITVGAGGAGRPAGAYAAGFSGVASSAFGATVGGGISNGVNNSTSGTPQSFLSAGNGAGAGGAASTTVAGPGFLSSITGTAYRYAAGGGKPSTAGGIDGGGAGPTSTTVGGNGAANSGSGGGSGSHSFAKASGAGGSGVVIVRYPDTLIEIFSTTGSPTVTVTGGYRIYRFTSSGSITF
jgi:hypothetical protein